MKLGQVVKNAEEEQVIQSTRRSVVYLRPQQKYAVYAVTGGLNSAVLKELLLEALAARGWDAKKIDSEYLRYAARCNREGVQNLFPGGRVA